MPSTPEDILAAVQTLTWRGDPATTDAVARELSTTHVDVAPVLVAVMRNGGVKSIKRPNGPSVWALTHDGEGAIADT